MTGQPPIGMHLIIDIHSDISLSDIVNIQECLKRAATACGAKILGANFHHFGEEAGVTGVLLLAESHISIHTWPELQFAAVDIFTCGACDPYLALPVLREFFKSDRINVRAVERRLAGALAEGAGGKFAIGATGR